MPRNPVRVAGPSAVLVLVIPRRRSLSVMVRMQSGVQRLCPRQLKILTAVHVGGLYLVTFVRPFGSGKAFVPDFAPWWFPSAHG
jgi:hypothetical protein